MLQSIAEIPISSAGWCGNPRIVHSVSHFQRLVPNIWGEWIHESHTCVRGVEWEERWTHAHTYTHHSIQYTHVYNTHMPQYTHMHTLYTYTPRTSTQPSLAKMGDTDLWLKYVLSDGRWMERLEDLHDGRRRENLTVGGGIDVSKSSHSWDSSSSARLPSISSWNVLEMGTCIVHLSAALMTRKFFRVSRTS